MIDKDCAKPGRGFDVVELVRSTANRAADFAALARGEIVDRMGMKRGPYTQHSERVSYQRVSAYHYKQCMRWRGIDHETDHIW